MKFHSTDFQFGETYGTKAQAPGNCRMTWTDPYEIMETRWV